MGPAFLQSNWQVRSGFLHYFTRFRKIRGGGAEIKKESQRVRERKEREKSIEKKHIHFHLDNIWVNNYTLVILRTSSGVRLSGWLSGSMKAGE